MSKLESKIVFYNNLSYSVYYSAGNIFSMSTESFFTFEKEKFIKALIRQ